MFQRSVCIGLWGRGCGVHWFVGGGVVVCIGLWGRGCGVHWFVGGGVVVVGSRLASKVTDVSHCSALYHF